MRYGAVLYAARPPLGVGSVHVHASAQYLVRDMEYTPLAGTFREPLAAVMSCVLV